MLLWSHVFVLLCVLWLYTFVYWSNWAVNCVESIHITASLLIRYCAIIWSTTGCQVAMRRCRPITFHPDILRIPRTWLCNPQHTSRNDPCDNPSTAHLPRSLISALFKMLMFQHIIIAFTASFLLVIMIAIFMDNAQDCLLWKYRLISECIFYRKP